jgi:hypothetical protein
MRAFQRLSLAVRALLFLLLAYLPGYYTENGFVKADDSISVWEETRLRQASIYVNEIKAILEKRKSLIVASLPEPTRNKLEGTTIRVLYQPLTAFSVRTNPSTKTIFFTTETYINLSKIAMAVEIGIATKDERWEDDYLLYLRGSRHTTPIIDPLRARGLLTAQGKLADGVTPNWMEELISDHSAMLEDMVMFLIAHELGHIINPSVTPHAKETDTERELRQREEEHRADEFAINALILTMHAVDTKPLYLYGGPELFLAWLHMSETANDNLFSATHPPHHHRARAVVRLINAKADGLGFTSKHLEQLRKVVSTTELELDQVDQNAEAYFHNLDASAAKISLKDLLRN